MKTPKTSQTRKPLRLATETIKSLDNGDLHRVIGGAAAGATFPCWTENNCPGPAV